MILFALPLVMREKPTPMRLLLFLLLAGTAIRPLSAQELSLDVRLSSDTLLAGHLLQVTFVVENAEVRDFTPPSFEGFALVSGPQRSSSMTMTNGKVRRETSITYLLAAEQPGMRTLEPARIQLADREIRTPKRSVFVRPNPGEIPDPRFPGYRPREKEPAPGDTLRQILKGRKSYRL